MVVVEYITANTEDKKDSIPDYEVYNVENEEKALELFEKDYPGFRVWSVKKE